MKNSSVTHGKICFTFDDRNFDSWVKSLPLWRKYDAHGTFFISGELNEDAVEAMKILQDAGHSVGLHAQHHAKYPSKPDNYISDEILPQLAVCRQHGIRIRSFAYPFSQRNDDSDRDLFEYFDFLRGGAWEMIGKNGDYVGTDPLFVPAVSEKQLFYGIPTCGNFDFDRIRTCFLRAAERRETLVFYAHDITSKVAASHHISTGQLEVLLKFARALNLKICGMNEL